MLSAMKPSYRYFSWAARIITILALIFISLFALDAFAPELTLGQQLLDFVLHLIPSLFLLFVLLIAWRWELMGGIILTTLGVVFSVLVFIHNYTVNRFTVGQCLATVAMVTLPFVVAGILFLVSHRLRNRL